MFIEISKEFGLNIQSIIDPAEKFNDHLLGELPVVSDSSVKTNINLKIESRAEILQEEIESVSSILSTDTIYLPVQQSMSVIDQKDAIT